MIFKNNMFVKPHRGLAVWSYVAVTFFFMLTITLFTVIMSSGAISHGTTKATVEEAILEMDSRLKIAGVISGIANVTDDKILGTATPIKPAAGKSIILNNEVMKINYKLAKIKSHVITYDNIYGGSIYDKSYNSLKEATVAAKNNGLLQINPFNDSAKPETTTAFVYWIYNINFDNNIDVEELAVLAVIYADKDRPSTGEQLTIDMVIPEGSLLKMERDIPHITSSIVDFGGKINFP